MFVKVCTVLVLSLLSVAAVPYNRSEEGFPNGFIPSCAKRNRTWSGSRTLPLKGLLHQVRLKDPCHFRRSPAPGLCHPKGLVGHWIAVNKISPEFSKPAIITPESLNNLYFMVMNPGFVVTASWTKYSYYDMRKLVKHPTIDFSKRTVVYVGGYSDFTWPMVDKTLGHVYRSLGYNVICLNALHFTARYFPIAARLMFPVGKHAAEMLVELTSYGLDHNKLDIVGISLGGNTASFIAKNFRQITGRNVSTLTGLDSGGPCFRHLGPEYRIDASDADFVLNVATNVDGYGTATPVAHVNFYVNGGEYQPSDIWFLPCTALCSHVKAFSLWNSALINPGTFVGLQCDSVQQAKDGDCYERKPRVTNTLDLFTDRSKPGIYYLATSHRYPYALGKRGLKRKHEPVTKQLKMLNEEDVLVLK